MGHVERRLKARRARQARNCSPARFGDLGRRCDAFPALVLATYRDDELERTHPLRIVLGELPRANVTRLRLQPLSVQAVAGLADRRWKRT